MHFKSVRTLVALMVGVCILLVVVALISYSLYADSRSQALVDVKTRALMTQSIDERLREHTSHSIHKRLHCPVSVYRISFLPDFDQDLSLALAFPGFLHYFRLVNGHW